MPADNYNPLRLVARDLEDLTVVSAMVQDAIVPVRDLAYFGEERAFVVALNRFRWEQAHEAETRREGGERVRAGLRFEQANRVAFRNIDRADENAFLSMLSVAYDDGNAVIHFAGSGAIRIAVDELHCTLRDFDEPWPTIWRPEHDGI